VLDLLLVDPPPPGQGFSWVNLVILLVIVALLWPLLQVIRRAATRYRQRVRARDGDDHHVVFTEENDPDLRRDDNRTPPS
jgi:hypothetical protein